MRSPARHDLRSIRIHPVLRGADVALMSSLGDAEVWYFAAHADLPPEDELPNRCVRVSPLSAVTRLFTTRARTIEIPEPLWARFLPMGLTLMVTARVARLVTGTPHRSVFYALENNEPHRALFGTTRVPTPLLETFVAALGAAVSVLIDRVAFASPGSQRAYRNIPTLRIKEQRVFVELPARTSVAPAAPCASRHRALFVGGLEQRKGISELMDAWEIVEREDDAAQLTIIGDGPFGATVERWVGQEPGRRRWLGRVAHADLQAHYAEADVLVAPSVRDGRWREQVGLQLREGLSAGLTLVVSDETGLAPWLDEHGHHVVPVGELGRLLPVRIAGALRSPVPPTTVRQALPRSDGRIEADRWLNEDG